MKMQLYLLRHGSSFANERHLVCGRADYPLSEAGQRQTEIVCAYLNRFAFSRIYVSPLSRARETIASLKTEAPVVVEPELLELDTGDVSELVFEDLWEIDARYRRPWTAPDLRYPGGETFGEMIARIIGWYDRTSPTWGPDDIVLIVGHEGTLRSIFLKLEKLTVQSYPTFPIGNCDFLRFEIYPDGSNSFQHVFLSELEEP